MPVHVDPKDAFVREFDSMPKPWDPLEASMNSIKMEGPRSSQRKRTIEMTRDEMYKEMAIFLNFGRTLAKTKKTDELKEEFWTGVLEEYPKEKVVEVLGVKNPCKHIGEILAESLGDISLTDSLIEKSKEFKPSEVELMANAEITVRELKERNFKVIVTSNTSYPQIVYDSIEPIMPLIDGVSISCELGVAKPDPLFIEKSMEKHNLESLDFFVIGDSISTDMMMSQQFQAKGIWVNHEPLKAQENIECLKKGFPYPRSVLHFSEVPSAIDNFNPEGIKVAYTLPSSSLKERIGLKSFQSTSEIWYNAIEPEIDLELQGNYEVLIQKPFNLIEANTEISQISLKNLQNYTENEAELSVIDSISCLDYCINRDLFNNAFQAYFSEKPPINGIKLKSPSQIVVPLQYNLEEIKDQMRVSEVNFPVLVKSNEACQSKFSHNMCMVFNETGLELALQEFEEEMVVEQFINHDKTVYKVYSVGCHIEYMTKLSAANVENPGIDLVKFESQEPWPEEMKSMEEEVVRELDLGVLDELKTFFNEKIGISLFGFDILVESETLDYYVIDLNPFPAFKPIKSLGPHMDELVRRKFNKIKL